jgi:hypothetical protein
MRSSTHSIADQAREHDRIFHAAFSAARQIRDRHVKVRPHRAITPLKATPYLLAQTVVLPLVMCGLLLLGKPLLLDFWRACILFWSKGLDLPFSISTRLNQAGQYAVRLTGGPDNAPMPDTTTLLVTTAITLAVVALSLRMKDAKQPLKYPLWIVCFVQAMSLLYFWLTPSTFPYSIAHHGEELMAIGFVVMLATPVMLAMGYYILNQNLAIKVSHTLLILLFLAVMVPHQVLAQALIMQHFSVLFMPVLYICFGAVFDALVFVALYSWAVSDVPANATV